MFSPSTDEEVSFSSLKLPNMDKLHTKREVIEAQVMFLYCVIYASLVYLAAKIHFILLWNSSSMMPQFLQLNFVTDPQFALNCVETPIAKTRPQLVTIWLNFISRTL